MNGLRHLIKSNFSYWIFLVLFGVIALVIGNICYQVISKLDTNFFLIHFNDLLTSISITFFIILLLQFLQLSLLFSLQITCITKNLSNLLF